VADSAEGPDPPRTRAALDGLAGLVLAQENTQSVLQRVVDLVKQAMPDGTEASITLMRNEQATTAAYTGELALQLDEMQYQQGCGPCLEAALGGRPVEVTDGRTEDRWPGYMATFLARGALSCLAVPVTTAQLAAGLNVYAPAADAFTDADRQALAEFAAYAAVALTNMDALADALDQAENLRRAMEYRGVIEQAKGILIERYKLTAEQAFRLLADASMHTNRKLRDLAQELVFTGELHR
jgi:GAF domain-containing protein